VRHLPSPWIGGGVRIVYKPGQDISVGFSTEPDVAMYEFLKDYLDFRITQMKKQKPE
jgi:hypothetical protein